MTRVRASVTLACALTALSVSTASATPVPHVTGPLAVSATSYPFGAADHQLQPQDLRKVGYVEEEFFASGQANVYSWPGAGPGGGADAERAVHHPLSRAPPGQGVALQRQRGRRDPQPVEHVRPQHRLGARAPPADRAQRRHVGRRHRQADLGRGAEELRPGPLRRRSWMANPLPARRSGQLRPSRASFITPASRARRTGWSRTSLARPAPGAAAPRARTRSPTASGTHPSTASTTSATRRPAASVRLRQRDPAARGEVRRPAGCSTATSSPSRAADFVGAAPINRARRAPPAGDPRRQFTGNVGTPIIHIMSQSDYLTGIDARRPDSDDAAGPLPPLRAGRRRARDARFELLYSATSADITKAGRVRARR